MYVGVGSGGMGEGGGGFICSVLNFRKMEKAPCAYFFSFSFYGFMICIGC